MRLPRNFRRPSRGELERRCREAEAECARLADVEGRARHLKQVLLGVRNVNQLITHEKDPDRLLAETCRLLVETQGYHNAWAALLKDESAAGPLFQAGLEGGAEALDERLGRGDLPSCARLTLERGGLRVVAEPASECPDCPLAEQYEGRAGFTMRLEHEDRVYGWMSVSVPEEYAGDEEERGLFAEVANDVAFALWSLEQETRRETAERKYAAVLETTRDAVIAVDLAGRIEVFNPGAEKLFECSADEALGTPVSRFCPEDLLDEQTSVFQRLQAAGEAVTYATERLTASGRRVPVEVTVSPRMDRSGRTEGVNAILRDISERVEARASYWKILEAATDGFWVVTPVGVLEEVNLAAMEMLGYAPEEMEGLRVEDIDANEDQETVRRHIERVRAEGCDRFETRHRRKDGALIDVEVSVSWAPIRGGRTVAFSRDITGRKRAESERETTLELLRHLNRPNELPELMREVTQLMRDWSGCEAVGIRLREGEDYPYYETQGFPAEFVELENSLCEVDAEGQYLRDAQGNAALECMCGNVLRGRFDPALPFFTGKGSFWTNSTSALLAATSEEDRQARTRNRCHGEGYESVALIPLRHGAETFGLLQFNDPAPGRFDEDAIALFERLAANLALGLSQRRAAEALREHQALLADAERLAGLGAWSWDTVRDRWALSENWLAIHGCQRPLRTTAELLPVAHPEDVARIEQAMEVARSGVGAYQLQHRIIRQDTGEVRYIQAYGEPVRNAAGAVVRVIGSALDVTAGKLNELALRESEERFRSILEELPGGVFAHDMDGRILLVNEAACRNTGYTREELARFTVAAIDPSSASRGDRISLWRTLRHGEFASFESTHRRRDGTEYPAEVHLAAVRLEGQPIILAIAFDISQRKEAEEAAYEAALRQDEVIRAAEVGLWDWDLATNNVTYSREWKSQIGYAEEEVGGGLEEWESRVHPEDLGRVKEAVNAAIESATERYDTEFRFRHKDGHDLWILAQAAVIRDESGQAVRVLGSHLDVTAQKQAEEALRESEERFRDVVSNVPGAVFQFVRKPDGAIEIPFMSQGAESVFERPLEQVLDPARLFEDIPAEDAERMWASIAESAESMAPWSLDFRIVTGSKEKWLRGASSPKKLEDGSICWSGMLLDITAQKKAQSALRESERRLATLMSNLPGMAYRCANEPNWPMEFLSEGCATLTGYSVDELLSEQPPHYGDLIHPEDREMVWNAIQEVISRKEPFELQYRITTASGADKWVWEQGRALYGPDGEATALEGFVADISERKYAEEALRASERKFAKTFQNAPLCVTITSVEDGRFLDVNDAFVRLTGYARDMALGRTSTEIGFASQEERERLRTILTNEGRLSELEFTVRRADGSEMICLYSGEIVEIAGRPRLLSIAADITERKRAERALRESEARFRALIESAPVSILLMRDGRYIYGNAESARMLGYETPNALIGLEALETIAPEHRDVISRRMGRIAAGTGNEALELQLVRADGHRVWVNSASVPVQLEGRPTAIIVGQDITERKRAEEALRESEGRVRAKLEAILSPEGKLEALALRDIIDSGTIQAVMEELYAASGIPVGVIDKDGEVLVAVGWQDICTEFHRRRPTTCRNCVESDVELSQGVAHGEYKLYRCKNGMIDIAMPIYIGNSRFGNVYLGQFFFTDDPPDVSWFETQAERYGFDREAYLDALSRVPRWEREAVEHMIRFLGGFADLIAQLSYATLKLARTLEIRKRTEEALKQGEERLRHVVSVTADLIYEWDVRTDRLEWFGDIDAELGYAPGTVPPTVEGWAALIHPEDAEALSDSVERHRNSTEPIRETYRVRRHDGSWVWWHDFGTPVFDDSGKPVRWIGGCRNVTRERNLEEQYRQAQKMEAIGQLTGGVAHDFNNILQVINGNTDLAIVELEEGRPVEELLSEVAEAGDRAARLISQLLTFSRRQIMRPEPLDLNDAIASFLKMIGRVIGEHVELQWRPGRLHEPIYADLGMVEQALMNVCVNARDAMPEGGQLVISTLPVDIDEAYCATHSWAAPGRYVRVTIADTGHGMDRETLARIFEPFFSTKEQGRGTGLGLATVYGIIKQHGGVIHAYSELGGGTTFKLYWPLSGRAERLAVEEGPEEAAGGAETVLLVEDDEMVRALAQNLLQRAGYRVLTATDGEDAVALFTERHNEIDLALIDVVLPKLGGRAAYDHMRALRPDLKALFASGYSEDAIHTNFVLEKGLRLIQKPFTRNDLLRAVRETLDGAAD